MTSWYELSKKTIASTYLGQLPLPRLMQFNTLRSRQNGRHFPDDTSKRIFLDENIRISIIISLKFIPKGPMNKIPALFQIMAWRRPGDKPLSEPMMVRLLTHVCVTRPQLVIIAQVYRLSAVHCQMTRYSQRVPGYLTRYSVSANEISFDKKISQWDCVFQIRLGLQENDSPLHLVTSSGFLKA